MPRYIMLHLAACCLFYVAGRALAAATPPEIALANPERVLALMEERWRQQLDVLASYEARRRYRAEHPRLSHPASMLVEERYAAAPASRTFTVLERRAPAFINRLLFAPLLEAEVAAARDHERAAVDISRSNYQFTFQRYDPASNAYIFLAEPRTTHPRLFRGLIWVDASDFAVTRIEGTPAQRPSLWVRENRFVHEFGKFGDFWLPIRHRSEAQLRMFGTATLEIIYSDYHWRERQETNPERKTS